MCQEWIKKNKIIIAIVILIIVVFFLYKKEENYNPSGYDYDPSGYDYDPSGYDFNTVRTEQNKILINNSNIEDSRLDNVLIENSLIRNTNLNNINLNGSLLQTCTLESPELIGTTISKDFRIEGELKFDDNVLSSKMIIIKNSEPSLIELTNSRSRITLGEQILTEDKLRFLNELYEKNNSAKNE
jgi:hypothetical protein